MNKQRIKQKYSFLHAFKNIKDEFVLGDRKRVIFNYLKVILGGIILAFSITFFLAPANVVSGGVSGLGIILASEFKLDVNIVITSLEWSFFVIGYILLGADFTIKTLLSTLIYPIFLFIFTFVRNSVPLLVVDVSDKTGVLISGLIGGGLVGVAVGVTFSGGGSTGGVDCLGLFLAKTFKIKTAIMTFIVDATIIVSNLFVGGIDNVLIGIIGALFTAFVLDKVYISSSKSYVAYIVSNNYLEINKSINVKLNRGTTLIDCIGGYTNKKKKMIQVAFSYDEYASLQKLVFSIDKYAFMTIMNASEVKGSGFSKEKIKYIDDEKGEKSDD